MKIGFSIEPSAPENVEPASVPSVSKENKPAPSMVKVRFDEDSRILTYYNDRYDLIPGDRVFVSGKLAGCPGTVLNVSTKFKISLSYYERILTMARLEMHGTYEAVSDKMVSFDSSALSPDRFRAWAMPPKEDDDPFICGDGYEISIPDLSSTDDLDDGVLERAVEYCRNGNVAYISVTDGFGTAFVKGTAWYEINFRLEGDYLTEMYCECPYPGLCKHLLAVALILKYLSEECGLDIHRNSVAIDDCWFWQLARRSAKRVTL